MNTKEQKINELREKYVNEQLAHLISKQGTNTNTSLDVDPTASIIEVAAIAHAATAASLAEIKKKTEERLLDAAKARAAFEETFNNFIADLNDDEKDQVLENPSLISQEMHYHAMRKFNIETYDSLIDSYKKKKQTPEVQNSITALTTIHDALKKLPKISATPRQHDQFKDILKTQCEVLQRNNQADAKKIMALFAVGLAMSLTLAIPIVGPLLFLIGSELYKSKIAPPKVINDFFTHASKPFKLSADLKSATDDSLKLADHGIEIQRQHKH